MGRDDFRLKHLAAVRADREEGAVGCAALLAKRRKHDVHDGIVIRQHGAKPVIEPSGTVTVRRTDELVVETEGIEKCLKTGVVMLAK